MLETMITLPPDESDWNYNSDVMFRVVKEPVTMTLTYLFNGSPMTIHYGSQDAVSSGTLGGTSTTGTLSIPANVTEFYLKQVKPGVTLINARVSGLNITEVTWNPELKTNALSLSTSTKLTKVSPYLPKEVTDIINIFFSCTIFNQDISGWDTSNVTNMNNLLRGATAFNQDISSWDTSQVTNMNSMFRDASSFNQNLSGWNVDKVTLRTNFDTGATAWQSDFKPKFV